MRLNKYQRKSWTNEGKNDSFWQYAYTWLRFADIFIPGAIINLLLSTHVVYHSWIEYFLLQFYCKHWFNKICFIFLVLLFFFQDLVAEVQPSLYLTVSEFNGNAEDESDLEGVIEQQFETLQKALRYLIKLLKLV